MATLYTKLTTMGKLKKPTTNIGLALCEHFSKFGVQVSK